MGNTVILLAFLSGLSGANQFDFAAKPSAPPLPQGAEINVYVQNPNSLDGTFSIQVQTRKMPVAELRLTKVTPDEYLREWRSNWQNATVGSTKVIKLDMLTALQKRTRPPEYLSRQFSIKSGGLGLYVLEAVGSRMRQPLAVSKLAILHKSASTKELLWVTSGLTGRPVPGALTTTYSKNAPPIAQGKADQDGVAVSKLIPGESLTFVRSGKDIFPVLSVGQRPSPDLSVHWVTDRPIYRPGNTVSWRAALRREKDNGWMPPSKENVKVTFRDSRDTVLGRTQLTTSDWGSAEGTFSIPKEAGLGSYTLVLEAADGQQSYFSVEVSAYRKPEFKVDVKTDKVRALAGEDVKVAIKATTYFGGAVSPLEASVQVRRGEFISDFGDFEVDDGTRRFSGETIINSKVYGDPQGNAGLQFTSRKDAPDSIYYIQSTVTDGARRNVEGGTEIKVYASMVRPYLKIRDSVANLGGLQHVTVRLRDWDGKPVKGMVNLWTRYEEWDKAKKNWVERLTKPMAVQVPASGQTEVQLGVPHDGSCEVFAETKDSTGRRGIGSASYWALGPFDKVSQGAEQPYLRLTMSKGRYAPGETIRAYAQGNAPGASKKGVVSPILIVWEGYDILDYRVLGGKAGGSDDIRALDPYVPMIYVSASQWVNGESQMTSERVPILDPRKQITVKLTPSKAQTEPGDTIQYQVTTRNSAGQPIAAEVTLAMVDEAIYAIKPDQNLDPLKLFWGSRDNKVQTIVTRAEKAMAAAFQGFEAGGTKVRSRFEDTALWRGAIRTDDSGRAVVDVPLPDNLTTWRMTAFALDPQTRAGSGKDSIVATKPVTLRLAAPRALVEGDAVGLIATVNNRTDKDGVFEVSLRGKTETVKVSANSAGTAEFPVSAPQGAKSQDFEASVSQAGKVLDALRISVPVLPHGLPVRQLALSFVGSGPVAFSLPQDTLAGRGTLRVVSMGSTLGLVRSQAKTIADERIYGVYCAVARLRAALLLGQNDGPAVTESLAYLSRTGEYSGWGQWDGAEADLSVTCAVAEVLGEASAAGIEVSGYLQEASKNALVNMRSRDGLLEHHALIESALVLSGNGGLAKLPTDPEGFKDLSAYARLQLARAFLKAGNGDLSNLLLESVLKDVSRGQVASYLPIGPGIGWTASERETNAALLSALVAANKATELWPSLALWCERAAGYTWAFDETLLLRGLKAYAGARGERDQGPQQLEITFGGKSAKTEALPSGDVVAVLEGVGDAGTQPVSVRGPDGARFRMELTTYRGDVAENRAGIRVLRRFEVQNSSGAWVETQGDVEVGKAVRCTIVAWGDSVPDMIRIVEPLPAGFEVVDQEASEWFVRTEVRDSEVVHYFFAREGQVWSSRYYLRSESLGKIAALPAWAEVLRRPDSRGNSVEVVMQVKDK